MMLVLKRSKQKNQRGISRRDGNMLTTAFVNSNGTEYFEGSGDAESWAQWLKFL